MTSRSLFAFPLTPANIRMPLSPHFTITNPITAALTGSAPAASSKEPRSFVGTPEKVRDRDV
jgi:hypothetical protein